jgi:hypothetical protein
MYSLLLSQEASAGRRYAPMSKAIRWFCHLALFFISSTVTHAASFDCGTAKHSNEELICQSTELSTAVTAMDTLKQMKGICLLLADVPLMQPRQSLPWTRPGG